MRAAAVFVLALFALQDPDKDAVKLRWSLKPTDFARYKAFRIESDNGKEKLVEYPNRATGIFGYEIEDQLVYKPPRFDWVEIPLILGFSLPARPMKVDAKTEFGLSLDNGYGYAPILAQGTATRRASAKIGDATCTEYVLQLKLRPHPKLRAATGQRAIDSGAFDAIVDFDAGSSAGAVRRLRFDFSITFAAMEGDANSKPETFKRSEQLDLVKVSPYRYDEFKKDVNHAIELGEGWIRRGQQKDGNWGAHYGFKSGPTALALLTLLKGTAKRDDPAIQKGLDWLLKQPLDYVYEVGVSMLALEEFYARPGEHEETAIGKIRESDITRKLSDEHREWMTKAAKYMEGALQTSMWTYQAKNTATDFSNTQYGLLGLQAAARCGIVVDENVYHKVLRQYLKSQEGQGPVAALALAGEGEPETRTAARVKAEARGWGYRDSVNPGDPATESMTCGGISSLAIAASVLLRMKSRVYGIDDAKNVQSGIRDGWAWLGQNFSVKANVPRGRDWQYYTLYGLERAASLNGVRKINEHDWYYEGAVWLVSNQAGDGAWCAGDWVWHHDVCFAVLFLKRATLRVTTGG